MPAIRVHAGHHRRILCPVRVPWQSDETPGSVAIGNSLAAAQCDGSDLFFLAGPLDAGEIGEYTPVDSPEVGGVRLEEEGGRIRVTIDGEEFTSYNYDGVPARPYFWPVLAPGGIPVTRAYPMQKDVPGETQDHPHHRSMYFAFGSVNGADNWSEEAGHGYTIHRSLDEVVSGPVFGRFVTTSDWTDRDRRRVLEQRASVTFWRGDGERRIMDVDLRLTATDGDVRFGDTKEGGLITIRVASSMDVPRGGRITNAYGGIDEPETWGHAAHWCDYSGVVDGRPVGIAVMDHPVSFRHPTYWHVRDYGLMGANPFALGDYTRGEKDGSHLLKAGETLRFHYRVLVHRGHAESADVRGQYLNFVAPPTAEVENA